MPDPTNILCQRRQIHFRTFRSLSTSSFTLGKTSYCCLKRNYKQSLANSFFFIGMDVFWLQDFNLADGFVAFSKFHKTESFWEPNRHGLSLYHAIEGIVLNIFDNNNFKSCTVSVVLAWRCDDAPKISQSDFLFIETLSPTIRLLNVGIPHKGV